MSLILEEEVNFEEETSESDSEQLEPRPPTKKLKQGTLPFKPALPSRSSLDSASPGSSINITTSESQQYSQEESTSSCRSNCCKESLEPYQPKESSIIQKTRKLQGK